MYTDRECAKVWQTASRGRRTVERLERKSARLLRAVLEAAADGTRDTIVVRDEYAPRDLSHRPAHVRRAARVRRRPELEDSPIKDLELPTPRFTVRRV